MPQQDKSTGRLRWASQRHPKGRPRKSTALSVLRRLSRVGDSGRPHSGESDLEGMGHTYGSTLSPNDSPQSPTAPSSTEASAIKKIGEPQEELKAEHRRIYFNMRLPPEETRDDGTPLHTYPRNKIRTAKYTPLTFIPKNLWLQFHNVANIYFFFIVILQVRNSLYVMADIDILHF
jgi:phospholipid-translocating ATPase